MKDAVLRFQFELGGHEFRTFWLPEKQEWLVVNHAGSFSFKGSENLGMGRVKAHMRKLLTAQYRFLLSNADRVICTINGVSGYLDTFRHSQRKAWARNAVLAKGQSSLKTTLPLSLSCQAASSPAKPCPAMPRQAQPSMALPHGR